MPSRTHVVLNFLLVYLIWGSTYLAIKIGVAEFPPLFMAAFRFWIAGAILIAIGKLRRESAISGRDRKLALVSGSFLVCANGLVCVAEKSLPSGLTAMMIGTIPAWISLMHWKLFGGDRPSFRQAMGILIAICGIALLARSGSELQGTGAWLGLLLLLCSVNLWSFGTLVQRKTGNVRNVFSFSGIQLGGGGFLIAVFALIFERIDSVAKIHFSAPAVGAFFYLVIFGSVIAFSSYLWLSRNVNPTKVSTYAVVNPLVAVWIGWLIAGEAISAGTLISSALIVGGIYFVIFDKKIAPA